MIGQFPLQVLDDRLLRCIYIALNIWVGIFSGWGRNEGSVEIMTLLPCKCQRLKRRTLADWLLITPWWRSELLYMKYTLSHTLDMYHCEMLNLQNESCSHLVAAGVLGVCRVWFLKGCHWNGILFPQNIKDSPGPWLLSYRAELHGRCRGRTFLKLIIFISLTVCFYLFKSRFEF